MDMEDRSESFMVLSDEKTIKYALVKELYKQIAPGKFSNPKIKIVQQLYNALEQNTDSEKDLVSEKLARQFCDAVAKLYQPDEIRPEALSNLYDAFDPMIRQLDELLDEDYGEEHESSEVTEQLPITPTCGSRFFIAAEEYAKKHKHPKRTVALGALLAMVTSLGFSLLGTYLYDLQHGTEAANFFLSNRIWDANSPSAGFKTAEGIYGLVGVVVALALLVWGVRDYFRTTKGASTHYDRVLQARLGLETNGKKGHSS